MKETLFLIFCCLFQNISSNNLETNNLKTNFLTNPIGIGSSNPLLSWEISSSNRNTLQTVYQIRAAYSEKDLNSEKKQIWNSGKIYSEQSVHVEYSGAPLKSGQRVYWQVRIWDKAGNISKWSNISFFEIGKLNAFEWKAAWIEPNIHEDVSISNPCPYLRKTFNIKKNIASARIYISSRGLYSLMINGKAVSRDLFTPGWTSYNKRIQYQVYDISSCFYKGINVIGVILGDGWYRGYLKRKNEKNHFGEKLAVITQIEIVYTDGEIDTIISDDTWKSSTGPILKSDIYNGEYYDARLEKNGWNEAGFDDSNWTSVKMINYDKNLLISSESDPVRILQIIKPVKKIVTPKNELVFDFGQNMTGIVQFKLRGDSGTHIKMNYAEVLDKNGNFYTENLQTAKAVDEYIFKSNGVETYQPLFTFHGFRFLKIENYNGEITLNDIQAKVISSDLINSGDFECSDTLINQLQHNIKWSLLCNFLDIPTDCPQRDERLGWTGDAQIFAPTACFNVNAANFFRKWMKDLAADQKEDGNVPHVVPAVKTYYGSAGWGDAAIIIPWVIYQTYGDKQILHSQYDSMKKWLEYCTTQFKENQLMRPGRHYGDWLAFSPSQSDYPGATTDKDFIATVYYAYSTNLISKIANVLGYSEDAHKYKIQFENIRKIFQSEFLTSNGRLSPNTQTAYTLALSFDLIPDSLKAVSAKKLADDVIKFGHITTGFLGTPLICDVLTENGYVDIAYKLLFHKDFPSWLYPITKGATTIWERWDGIKTDGTFQNPSMNSFNHYAYGAIGNWLYTKVAGIMIDNEDPGYRSIIIKPYPTKQLNYAKARYQSTYGTIISHWEIKESVFILNITIPANTTAKIYLPANSIEDVKERGLPLSKIHVNQNDFYVKENRIVIEVGSGDYNFTIPMANTHFISL